MAALLTRRLRRRAAAEAVKRGVVGDAQWPMDTRAAERRREAVCARVGVAVTGARAGVRATRTPRGAVRGRADAGVVRAGVFFRMPRDAAGVRGGTAGGAAVGAGLIGVAAVGAGGAGVAGSAMAAAATLGELCARVGLAVAHTTRCT